MRGGVWRSAADSVFAPSECHDAADLRGRLEAKERAGCAARQQEQQQAPPLRALAVDDEHRLRVSGASFLWDLGRSHRLSAAVPAERAANAWLRNARLLKRDAAFAAGDAPHNAAVLKGLPPPPADVKDAVKALSKTPTEKAVQGAEAVLSAAAGTAVTRHALFLCESEGGDAKVRAARATVAAWADARGVGGAAAAGLAATVHALALFHRFFLVHSFRAYDRFLVAGACALVAYKHAELLPVAEAPCPRTCADALAALLPARYPAAAAAGLCGALVRLETAVLRAVGCDLQYPTPHAVVLLLADTPADEPDPKRRRVADAPAAAAPAFPVPPHGVVQAALALLNDAHVLSDITLRTRPAALALAALACAAAAAAEAAVVDAAVQRGYAWLCHALGPRAGDAGAHAALYEAVQPERVAEAWREVLGMYEPAAFDAGCAAQPQAGRGEAAEERAGRWRGCVRAAAARAALGEEEVLLGGKDALGALQ